MNGLVVLHLGGDPVHLPRRGAVAPGAAVGAAREGVELAAQITLKSNAIVLAFMALVATMPLATAGHALHRLRVPDKIVHLLLMTYRYIFVLEQEYQRAGPGGPASGASGRAPTCTPTAPTPTWSACCSCGPSTAPSGSAGPCCAGASSASSTACRSSRPDRAASSFCSDVGGRAGDRRPRAAVVASCGSGSGSSR
ncbi:MAG: energy-coupling factor transporter transmembrane protein EcfT [Desulfobacterales bacterium]|nr:energy-coupling factor transporter transmembrane protein EcfT [Desulfobacterales bacterium]